MTKCMCTDPGCPACLGFECQHDATQTLYRVDMVDMTGQDFCDLCAEDAMNSGLFTFVPPSLSGNHDADD